MLRIACAIVLRHIVPEDSVPEDTVLRDNGFPSSETIWVAPGTAERTTQVSSRSSSTQEMVMTCLWPLGSPSR
jgi:hypothetical protein